MLNCEMDNEEIEEVIKKYFTPEEWQDLADIFKIRYRNMYRNYMSVPDAENVMPLPEFMRRSQKHERDKTVWSNNKENESQRDKSVEAHKKSKKSKFDSKTQKRNATDVSHIRRNPKRNVSKVDYYEPEEPKDDRYVFCDNCNEEYVDFCSKCGMLVSLKDYPVAMGTENRAKKTVPKDILEIRASPIHGFGVFTLRTLRQGIQMGPYQGHITRIDSTNGYSWKLRDGRLVDAVDEMNSNWMRYVNCARNVAEQNTVAFQYKGNLYYRTCKEIKKGEELLVYYGQNFAKILGIDTKKYFQPEEEELNLNYFTCKFCHVALSSREFRDSHQIRCKFRPNRMVVFGNEDDFSCQYCHCCLTTMEYLKQHEKYCKQKRKGDEKTNVVERKYQCLYCEYKSTRKSHLKRHVRTIHEKQTCPKFQCEECKYETVHKTSLLRHERTHKEKLMYKCRDCPDKGFNSKHALDSHILVHHPNLQHLITSKVSHCTLCEYRTVYTTRLKEHMLFKHPEYKGYGNEKFQCDICEYSTVQKGNLQVHLRTHANSRPFVCSDCNKGFIQKSHLDGHFLVHHPSNPTLLKMITHKIHSCDVCTYRTIFKTTLTRHIKRNHIYT